MIDSAILDQTFIGLNERVSRRGTEISKSKFLKNSLTQCVFPEPKSPTNPINIILSNFSQFEKS
jgi:hypothetical protein